MAIRKSVDPKIFALLGFAPSDPQEIAYRKEYKRVFGELTGLNRFRFENGSTEEALKTLRLLQSI